MTIVQLPEPPPPRIIGVSRRTFPRQLGDGALDWINAWDARGCRVTVVLVAGDPDVGDYAAYYGSGSDEWVAHQGDKLSFEEACVHFPGGQLEKARYRR